MCKSKLNKRANTRELSIYGNMDRPSQVCSFGDFCFTQGDTISKEGIYAHPSSLGVFKKKNK